MAFTVKTESFEGPFDLLLYLVSKKKVNIGAISISQIADQYMAEVQQMKNLNLDVASDFLLVAATLLEIKAHALIPKPKDELADEISELSPLEARDVLISKLIDFKKFKNASEELYQRYQSVGRLHPRLYGPDSEFLEKMPDFLEGITLDALGYMAANAMARREVFLLESEHIASKPMSLELHAKAIQSKIRAKRQVRFSELIEGNKRPEYIVVTFLALLELFKRRLVYLEQKSAFGDIEVTNISDDGSSEELVGLEEYIGED